MPHSKTQSEMYARYNDNYDPSAAKRERARYASEDYTMPQYQSGLAPYHMKGRILSYLSFPFGLVTVIMMFLAFVGPIEASTSANLTVVSLGTGLVGILLGLAGKIRGRKELDLPRWPSSFGMMFGFLGFVISGMVTVASIQTYMNYGEMLAEQKAEKENETVVSYALDDGGTREATDSEKESIARQEANAG